MGLKVHPLFGWLVPEEGKSNGATTGFSYGLMGDFYLKERYAFSTEFALTTMGGSIKQGDSQNGEETEYKLKYVEIPISLKLKTNKIGEGQLYGQFGFVPGIKVGAKISGTITENGVSRDYDNESISSNINPFRLSLLIGGGYEYYIDNSTRITAGLSLNNGFTDVFSAGEAKNSYVAINLGIFF
ncbi:hypothetical protein D3C78_1433070 [compost metagenome]